ncbi:MAG: hotdog family protein [Methylococcaceae bacterium]|nr:hotdog family protein [Methylococcaceae bacterium]MDD1607411.1 hotdog family protein [Methylococcaceae bacterium]
MTDFNHIAIAELIPHSGNMIFLDRIIAADETSLTAELVVRGDGLLGNDTTVPAWAGIEYMAQTVAAYAGLIAKQQGEAIRLGFLLGTRRYHSNVAEFSVGSLLTIRVEKIMQNTTLGVFDCCIQGVGVDVRSLLNVYQPPTDV